jgi:glucose-1-phosphate thymidylyltransferase
MKAVILAAGKGTRLYPVTKAIAKPLLPLANRTTLEYAFDQFHECGIHEVCIVVGENENEMKRALGDGSAFNLHLQYVRQPEAKGLAHAVGFAKDFVAGDSFMLYLGDAIYTDTLKPYVEQFKAGGIANLNVVKWVEDPRRFGVANIENGRIVKLVEKPQNPESNWAMAGVYLFGPELWEVLPDLKPSWRDEYEITDAIQLIVDRGYSVVPGEFPGEWFDTGTLDSFLETSHWITRGGSVIAPDARVDAEIVGHVVIGSGARIKAGRITDSVILPGSHIESDGPINRCILGGDLVLSGPSEGLIKYGDLT